MPFIQNQVVDIHGWLTMKEFADVITISQMTPGPIAINSATFVGIRIGGIAGAVAATIGCVLPSCIIVLTLAYIYNKYRGLSTVQGILNGLRPAVIALILSAGMELIILSIWDGNGVTAKLSDIDFAAIALFGLSFFVLRKWKVNPIHVMVGSGIIGLCIYPLLS